jgi:pantetheine-phosphate adenylyltransferase
MKTWSGSGTAWLYCADYGPTFAPSHELAMKTTSTDPLRTAVFTGTFDPITLGHLDVISRGCLLFEHLVVAIGVNPNKTSLFSIEERVEMASHVVRPFPNVTVQSFEGLTVQFVKRIGARVILRGLRTLSDMEYEFGMTLTNHRLDPSVETVFLMADGEYSHVSSTLIKQVACFGGTEALKRFVPAELIGPILSKLQIDSPPAAGNE